MRVYEEGTDAAGKGGDKGVESDAQKQAKLPALTQGQALSCDDLDAVGHVTRPPGRYSEASFVKELEALGIGRPSTYAQILETLKDRGYVTAEGKTLCPSLVAVVVVQLLERHFEEFVDTAFTARMELSLDRIALGEADKETYLSEYYLGPAGLRDKVRMSEEKIVPEEARRALLPIQLDTNDSDASRTETYFRNVSVSVGPYGAYAQARGGCVDGGEEATIKANLPDAVCKDVVLLTREMVHACLEAKQGPHNGTLLGYEDESGLPVLMRVGRFGAYLQVGEDAGGAGGGEGEGVKPRTVSLPKDVALGQVDMAMAKKFLSLPRVVCMHPETGKEVFAGVGPYGAFVRHSTTYRSLSAADDVLSVTPERALDLLATASKSSLASQAMAHIGQLDGKNITVMNGRYGPYLKFGVVNAQIPPLYRDMPEEVPLAEAIQAIQAKADAKRGTSPAKARRAAASKPKAPKTAAAAKGAGRSRAGGKDSAAGKSSVEGGVAKRAAAPAGAKRSKTAFLFFCAEKRAQIAERGLSFGEINRELGEQWKSLSADERAPYEELAALDKLRHAGAASTEKQKTSTRLGVGPSSTSRKTSGKALQAKTPRKTPKKVAAAVAKELAGPAVKRPRSARCWVYAVVFCVHCSCSRLCVVMCVCFWCDRGECGAL